MYSPIHIQSEICDTVASVPESWVRWRAIFQSGSRVLKKVFWTLYLCHTMWFHAENKWQVWFIKGGTWSGVGDTTSFKKMNILFWMSILDFKKKWIFVLNEYFGFNFFFWMNTIDLFKNEYLFWMNILFSKKMNNPFEYLLWF